MVTQSKQQQLQVCLKTTQVSEKHRLHLPGIAGKVLHAPFPRFEPSMVNPIYILKALQFPEARGMIWLPMC